MTEPTRARTLGAVFVLTCLPLLRAQGEPTVERMGRHFRVVLHRGDLDDDLAGKLADQARSQLEQFAGVLDEMLGKRDGKVRSLHLYRQVEDYLAIEKSTSSLPFSTTWQPTEPVGSFSDANGFVGKDDQGHLRLVPHLSAELLGEVGLPTATVSALFRVAAEAVLAALIGDDDPHGFLRGLLAMGAVETAMNPNLEYGVDAAFDYRRTTILSRRGLGHEFTLASTTATDTDWANRGHWQGGLIDLAILAQHLRETDPRWARKVMARWSRSRKELGELARRTAAVRAVVGLDRTVASARFAAMVEGFAPEWTVSRDLWRPGKRSMLVGTPEADACVAYAPHVPPGDYRVSARVELGPGEQRPLVAYLRFMRDSLSAWVHAGSAGIARLDSERREYVNLAEAGVDTRQGAPFDLGIEVTDREVRILIDEKLVCSCEHDLGLPRGDAFSLQVLGRMVWLEGLEWKPLPAGAGRK